VPIAAGVNGSSAANAAILDAVINTIDFRFIRKRNRAVCDPRKNKQIYCKNNCENDPVYWQHRKTLLSAPALLARIIYPNFASSGAIASHS
jgi:hypothetical protein